MKKLQLISKILLILFILSASSLVYLYKDIINQESIKNFISIAPVIMFPNIVLTVIGGILFGPFFGSLYVLISCTIGSTLAFLAGRYIARDWVEANASGKILEIKSGIDKHGWKFVAVTRLLPFCPFTILNFVYGLSKISALSYAITSFIFMSPLVIFYVYLGHKTIALLHNESL